MFNSLPKLKAGLFDVFRESIAVPFFFLAIWIQGETALHIEDGELNFKPTRIEKVDVDGETLVGAIVDGEFIPGDGEGTILRCYRQRLVVVVGNINELLNPATTSIDENDVADPQLVDVELDPIVLGDVPTLRAKLAVPFWLTALAIQGTTGIKIGSNRRVSFKKARLEKEPELGLVVGKEFKKAGGAGVLFTKFGSTIGLAPQGMEGLWNPATAEILRATEAAEMGGESVGAREGEKAGVKVRETTAVNVGRLSDYQPFAMMDGTSTRKQMNTAFDAWKKKEKSSSIGRYAAIATAFMLGALSPRLNGSTGGGGGGGSANISGPVDMPSMIDPVMFDPSTVELLGQVAALGVL